MESCLTCFNRRICIYWLAATGDEALPKSFTLGAGIMVYLPLGITAANAGLIQEDHYKAFATRCRHYQKQN